MKHTRETPPGVKRNRIYYSAIALFVVLAGLLVFVLARPHATYGQSPAPTPQPAPPASLVFTCDASRGSPVDWVATNGGGQGILVTQLNGVYGNGADFDKMVNGGRGVYIAPGQTVSGYWYPYGSPPGNFSRSCTIATYNGGLQ